MSATILTVEQCAQQFELYAKCNPSPDSQHSLRFCANFLREFTAPEPKHTAGEISFEIIIDALKADPTDPESDDRFDVSRIYLDGRDVIKFSTCQEEMVIEGALHKLCERVKQHNEREGV